MKHVPFGKTGHSVSHLCLGTLIMGPLQAHLPLAQGVAVMERAWEMGVNFFDTAELYDSQVYIGALPPHIRHNAVITTKSYSETPEKMKASVEKALREMKLDVIPIFLLHEQESALTLKGHWKALEVLLEYKQKGLIKTVGVSTHTIEITRLIRIYPEIECVFSMFNIEGYGIKDGTQAQMEYELEKAYNAGKGVYLMKVLGGGKLLHRAREALEYAIKYPFAHSVAVGIKHIDELEWNVALFEGREPEKPINAVPRKMLVSFWCEGCGVCAQVCPQHAIEVADGKAHIDHEKCIVCTYCTGHCPLHCLRVI
ncbi:MAG: aldo/keto reductase [Caldisericia bacterium]|nr:aldo/keto reductase [Caldisericia bacterium]